MACEHMFKHCLTTKKKAIMFELLNYNVGIPQWNSIIMNTSSKLIKKNMPQK